MTQTRYWHLIQYDIRCPRRGQKIYRLLKSCAFALQESVFAWQGTDTELQHLQQQLQERINPREDDIRGYRIDNPLLLFGQSPFASDVWFQGYPPHQHCPLEWLAEPPPGF
tara:strand:+ start:22314 stop:22646 length:333 start_codon:yes stop_codon:yes gene_type:complete